MVQAVGVDLLGSGSVLSRTWVFDILRYNFYFVLLIPGSHCSSIYACTICTISTISTISSKLARKQNLVRRIPYYFVRFFFFLHIPFFFFALVLSPSYSSSSRDSDPGSQSWFFSLPPHYAWFVPCIFIARRRHPFHPSSTRIELCLPTLLGALSR